MGRPNTVRNDPGLALVVISIGCGVVTGADGLWVEGQDAGRRPAVPVRRHIHNGTVREADGVMGLVWSGGISQRAWTMHASPLHRTSAEALI